MVSEVCSGSVTSDGFHWLFFPESFFPSSTKPYMSSFQKTDAGANWGQKITLTPIGGTSASKFLFPLVESDSQVQARWAKRPLQLEKESLPSLLIQRSERVVTYEGDLETELEDLSSVFQT